VQTGSALRVIIMPLLYQKEWNGIELVAISKQPNTMKNGVPSALFYEKFYSQMEQLNFPFSNEWLAEKAKITEALCEEIGRVAAILGKPPCQIRVLSVGAGFGVVELPLLEKGLSITLHEVQENSLRFAIAECEKKNIPKPETLSGFADDFQTLDFDLIYLGCIEYCFCFEKEYLHFLKTIHKKMRKNSFLWSWEPSPTIVHYILDALIKLNIKPQTGIVWGKLRSTIGRARAYKNAGFSEISFSQTLKKKNSKLFILRATWLRSLMWFGKPSLISLHAKF
jgi:2-polyprenyl-3-methyl-5-hydroxy-6-metoxy-1,4-benzoquinol methylase